MRPKFLQLKSTNLDVIYHLKLVPAFLAHHLSIIGDLTQQTETNAETQIFSTQINLF